MVNLNRHRVVSLTEFYNKSYDIIILLFHQQEFLLAFHPKFQLQKLVTVYLLRDFALKCLRYL